MQVWYKEKRVEKEKGGVWCDHWGKMVVGGNIVLTLMYSQRSKLQINGMNKNMYRRER